MLKHPLFQSSLIQSSLIHLATAFIAGALLTLSLAPFNYWPVAWISPLILFILMTNASPRLTWKLATGFGIGLFTTGASWVYVSIHHFGAASFPLAVFLTGFFVVGLGLLFGFLFLPFALFKTRYSLWNILLFSATWAVSEWVRSWLLTGFPWLYLGYSQLTTPLAGFAPLFGILGIGFFTLLTTLFLGVAVIEKRWLYLTVSLTLLVCGWGAKQVEWTQPSGETLNITLIQGNIPQERKWDPDFFLPTIERYLKLSQPYWENSDWMIWPEAAIPQTYHRSFTLLEDLDEQARLTNTSFITGVLYDDYDQYKIFNSVQGLGLASGRYHKQHLVPFGEYVPLEHWLRQTIQFFNLPTSIISPGPEGQSGLMAQQIGIAPSLCYEIVFADTVATMAQTNHVLLTISNDAWFGDSIGPHQHLQMAQVRALETGRYLIRSTNNGITAVVNQKGIIQARLPQFIEASLHTTIRPYTGQTPFMRWQSWPIVIGSLLILLLAGIGHRRFLVRQKLCLTEK